MATTGVAAYSTTAGSNTSVGGVSIAEGMSPASVNNAMRAIVADVAVMRNLLGGSATTGGSADAQTLTTGMTLAALQQGLLIGFEAGYTNTGAATLNVDSIGPKSIKTPAGAALSAGMLTAGGIYLVAYESDADVFILIGAQAVALSATLSAIGALTPTDSGFIVGDGSTWVLETGATLRTSLGLGTGNSPQFTGIEVGASSDTTLTRSSAGVLAVEGIVILTVSSGVPKVTGSQFPVNYSGLMEYTSSTSLAAGASTSGSNLRSPVAEDGGPDNQSILVNGDGAQQTGTWRNDSGATMDADGPLAYGVFTRTA